MKRLLFVETGLDIRLIIVYYPLLSAVKDGVIRAIFPIFVQKAR